jgi:hypothetical protein
MWFCLFCRMTLDLIVVSLESLGDRAVRFQSRAFGQLTEFDSWDLLLGDLAVVMCLPLLFLRVVSRLVLKRFNCSPSALAAVKARIER